MNRYLCFSLVVGFAAAASAADSKPASGPTKSPDELHRLASEITAPLPKSMPGAEKDTKHQIRLGKKLFFETRLSANNSISCNSCHAVDPGRGGVDNQPTSPGGFGKRGDRNSPTVLNAGFHFAQFWDGRAATLEDQAKGPVLNPIEMAMPSEAEVVQRLSNDAEYTKMFRKAFPNDPNPITYQNVANAIAAFERTLITKDRFDDFLNGKGKALSPLELKGLETFLTVGCTTCHNSPTLGGNSYQKAGLVSPYENTQDLGRGSITKLEDDNFKFKVPSLRNVALTWPYFHDGKVKSLDAAVQKMASMQLGLTLDKEQTAALVAFLNSLSDKQRAAKR